MQLSVGKHYIQFALKYIIFKCVTYFHNKYSF